MQRRWALRQTHSRWKRSQIIRWSQSSIYNRIALDASTVDIRHVKLDSENQYLEDMDSELNNLFNLEANIDQSARAFKHDIYLSV